MLKEHTVENFKTLERAIENGDAALMECTDKETGNPVSVICVANRNEDDMEFIPVARMYTFEEGDNPFDTLNPPE